ncbi:hypothetical protein Ahy_B01g055808 [Arachis hypogaea]|uniref:Aminotransferase-like plant mobile domain-containing protein n=1 Tax=Arachis hypogaea TaxID=3818 RepID=A0A445AX65_ARAHY|nr:hypothetical protein Ahy_B01g055808 [Arachis hypogaea]
MEPLKEFRSVMELWGVSPRCDGVVEEIGATDGGTKIGGPISGSGWCTNRWHRLASRMLMCDHLHPPDPYNQIVESQLRETGFYYVSQIGVIKGQSVMINALIERWRPETHTFHFPVGECAVTLEDVAVILGLPTNGLPVTGPTMSSFEALEAECLHQFGIAPRKTDCRGSFIKLKWFRGLKDRIVLIDDVHIQMYISRVQRCTENFYLCSETSFSWGSACLAHLYRSLCRATRVDCKEMDGPLTLLVTWAWIRLPFLAPIPGNPRVFPIANRWHNWDRQNYAYRYKTLAHYRRLLDDLQEGQFRLIYPIVHTSTNGIIFHCLDYCLP